ncbi:hypothetical protein SNEBB_006589 [Seison nebaliae]|nr:hypothetical protein SNEBB_006589 [Seison nebaliae]
MPKNGNRTKKYQTVHQDHPSNDIHSPGLFNSFLCCLIPPPGGSGQGSSPNGKHESRDSIFDRPIIIDGLPIGVDDTQLSTPTDEYGTSSGQKKQLEEKDEHSCVSVERMIGDRTRKNQSLLHSPINSSSEEMKENFERNTMKNQMTHSVIIDRPSIGTIPSYRGHSLKCNRTTVPSITSSSSIVTSPLSSMVALRNVEKSTIANNDKIGRDRTKSEETVNIDVDVNRHKNEKNKFCNNNDDHDSLLDTSGKSVDNTNTIRQRSRTAISFDNISNIDGEQTVGKTYRFFLNVLRKRMINLLKPSVTSNSTSNPYFYRTRKITTSPITTNNTTSIIDHCSTLQINLKKEKRKYRNDGNLNIFMKDQWEDATKSLLPKLSREDDGKKCLIIDLDETLVHSSFKPVTNADLIVSVDIDGQMNQVYVLKRPHVDEFLRRVGELFECVLFTASLAKYADPVADFIDKWKVFRKRLFREACVMHNGNFVKDLTKLGRDINQVIILDNSPASFMFQPENAIQCRSWFDDPNDTELRDLIPMMEELARDTSVYPTLGRYHNQHPQHSNVYSPYSPLPTPSTGGDSNNPIASVQPPPPPPQQQQQRHDTNYPAPISRQKKSNLQKESGRQKYYNNYDYSTTTNTPSPPLPTTTTTSNSSFSYGGQRQKPYDRGSSSNNQYYYQQPPPSTITTTTDSPSNYGNQRSKGQSTYGRKVITNDNNTNNYYNQQQQQQQQQGADRSIAQQQSTVATTLPTDNFTYSSNNNYMKNYNPQDTSNQQSNLYSENDLQYYHSSNYPQQQQQQQHRQQTRFHSYDPRAPSSSSSSSSTILPQTSSTIVAGSAVANTISNSQYPLQYNSYNQRSLNENNMPRYNHHYYYQTPNQQQQQQQQEHSLPTSTTSQYSYQPNLSYNPSTMSANPQKMSIDNSNDSPTKNNLLISSTSSISSSTSSVAPANKNNNDRRNSFKKYHFNFYPKRFVKNSLSALKQTDPISTNNKSIPPKPDVREISLETDIAALTINRDKMQSLNDQSTTKYISPVPKRYHDWKQMTDHDDHSESPKYQSTNSDNGVPDRNVQLKEIEKKLNNIDQNKNIDEHNARQLADGDNRKFFQNSSNPFPKNDEMMDSHYEAFTLSKRCSFH